MEMAAAIAAEVASVFTSALASAGGTGDGEAELAFDGGRVAEQLRSLGTLQAVELARRAVPPAPSSDPLSTDRVTAHALARAHRARHKTT